MNNLEINNFVTEEIQGRAFNRELSDATRGDWIRAIWKAGSLETARAIVRQIVDNPELTMTPKTFYQLLKKSGVGVPQGKATLIYGEGFYEVCAICYRPSKPDWVVRLSYPTTRFWENGTATSIPWTEMNLMEAMQPILREVRATYGGEWILSVFERKAEPRCYPADRLYGQRTIAEAEILKSQVRTPGRVWLECRAKELAKKLAVQDPPPVKTTASREMIERLNSPSPEVPKGPTPFDPENDPELKGDV